MDVDCYSFQDLLPSMLEAIASSRFISLDLELSGIPRKRYDGKPHQQSDRGGKPSLQKRYEESKAAAEKFQILQMGLTCVEEDMENAKYIVRPYNIHVSPLIDKRLKLERDLTFQNDAVDFLMNHKFNIEAPFRVGVSYLSWEEEARARDIAQADLDKDNIPDISITPGDTASFELMKRVRREIAIWRQSSPMSAFLNIPSETPARVVMGYETLNRYQKRLVHQLIRAEYPDLVSITRGDFIQLMPFDRKRENAQKAKKLRDIEQVLIRQVGLRWIIEAICSKTSEVLPAELISPMSLSETLREFLPPQATETNERHHSTPAQSTNDFKRPALLVGHNLFLDLIYLYACFFGPLPSTLESFKCKLQDLFPAIIDTKYIFEAANKDSSHINSSLADVARALSGLQAPDIEIPVGFEKYNQSAMVHEAGYDSLLAARILLQLTSTPGGYSVSSGPNDSGLNAKEQSAGRPESPSSDTSFEESPQFPPPAPERRMLPSEGDEFWADKTGKLRVNGTSEGLCHISRDVFRDFERDNSFSDLRLEHSHELA